METVTVPVRVVEQEVVDLWRTVGSGMGLVEDVNIARFLLGFYLGHKPAQQNYQCYSCLRKPVSSTATTQTNLSLLCCDEELELKVAAPDSSSLKSQQHRSQTPAPLRHGTTEQTVGSNIHPTQNLSNSCVQTSLTMKQMRRFKGTRGRPRKDWSSKPEPPASKRPKSTVAHSRVQETVISYDSDGSSDAGYFPLHDNDDDYGDNAFETKEETVLSSDDDNDVGVFPSQATASGNIDANHYNAKQTTVNGKSETGKGVRNVKSVYQRNQLTCSQSNEQGPYSHDLPLSFQPVVNIQRCDDKTVRSSSSKTGWRNGTAACDRKRHVVSDPVTEAKRKKIKAERPYDHGEESSAAATRGVETDTLDAESTNSGGGLEDATEISTSTRRNRSKPLEAKEKGSMPQKYMICDGVPRPEGLSQANECIDIYQCSRCLAKFPLKCLARRHMRVADCCKAFRRPPDKFPMCDGTVFEDGIVPLGQQFSEMKCTRCGKVFSQRHYLHRHLFYDENCEFDEDHFVKKFGYKHKSKTKGKGQAKADEDGGASDPDWDPTNEIVPSRSKKDESNVEGVDFDDDEDLDDEEKVVRKPRRYRFNNLREHTIHDFWTGRMQGVWGFKVSHYFCVWCGAIFDHRGKHKLKRHLKKCDKVIPGKRKPPGPPPPVSEEGLEILRRVKEKYLLCCDLCERVFYTKELFNMHVMSHCYAQESDGGYVCLYCGNTFTTYTDITHHVKIPKKMGRQCKQCPFQFKSYCQVQNHFREHEQEKRQTCQTCGESLAGKTKKEIRQHHKDHDNKCEVCNLSFVNLTKKEVNLHTKTHEEKGDDRAVKTICPFCGQQFAESRMSNHIKRCTRTNETFPCRLCSKVCGTKSARDYHELVHGEKTVVCEHCGHKFYTQRRLRDHIRNKHEGLEIRCQECGKLVSSINSLRIHIKRVHRKVKNHACRYCPAQYFEKNERRDHERTHTKEKPFSCPHCDYVCIRQDYLRKHVATHMKVKPRKCEDCSASFSCVGSLKMHRQNHHKYSVYRCPDCPQQFCLKGSLDHHRHREHGAQNPGIKMIPDNIKFSGTSGSGDFVKRETSYGSDLTSGVGNERAFNSHLLSSSTVVASCPGLAPLMYVMVGNSGDAGQAHSPPAVEVLGSDNDEAYQAALALEQLPLSDSFTSVIE